MKIEKKIIDSKPEKNVITGLIVSDRFIQEISKILKVKYLQSSYSKIIAKWCIEYFEKYKKAPKQIIEELFKYNEENLREEDKNIIEKFLSELSQEYEKLENFNEQFLIDSAEKYLAERNLQILIEKIQGNIYTGKIDEAELCITNHVRVQRPLSSSIDVLNDKQAIITGINYEEDILFSMPGALGELIGPLCRSDFFGIIGPMKRGKSWWLEEFAIQAMLNDLKVLFISMEMPRNQMIMRLYQNFLSSTKKPSKSVSIPYLNEEEMIEYKNVRKKGITVKAALKKVKAMQMMVKGAMRLLCRPARSMNVDDIRTEVYNLAYYDNFFPDVIVWDYADISSPERDSPKDARHRIDHTWSSARALAQEINGLLITSSQSTRSTFTKDISEEEIAEDIRKLAHVTHMMALNQNKEEKRKQIMRISMLANRNENFQTEEEVTVIYQYAVGKAHLDSTWKKF